MHCLEKIIGISKSTCECFGEDRPSDYNESASGVFLDKLDYFNPSIVKSGDDCSRGGYWDRAQAAIENAKRDYKNDLFRCVGTTYRPRINPLNIQLGSAGFRATQNITTQYAGMKLSPMQIKSGFIVIKKIGIIVNQNVPVIVKIFSNENNGTLIYESSPINATANILTWAAPEPIELPMWSYATNIRYYVVLQLDGTFQPKDNNKDCGCSGVQRPYLRYMDFEGTTGSDETNVNNFASTKSINGIVLDVDIKCKASDIICSDENTLDFSEDSNSLGMAYAIRFRAAALLYEEVLSTDNITRQTLMNREEIANYVKYWNGEYMNWITYICSNFNLNDGITGCFICKDVETTLQKNTIRATGHHNHEYHTHNFNPNGTSLGWL